jgi:hypothetical protein
MGLRGPGARPLAGRYRQNYYADPKPTPAQIRRATSRQVRFRGLG